MITRRRMLIATAAAAGTSAATTILAAAPDSRTGTAAEGNMQNMPSSQPASLFQLEADIRAWDAIEDHRTGSPGDLRTARWLASEIEKAGATPETVEFPLTRRIPLRASVSDGANRVGGLPLFDSAVTSIQLTATAGALGSDAQIAVTRFGPVDRDPRTIALHEARKKDSHQAIIAIAAGDQIAPGLAVVNAENFRTPFGPAVIQVPTESGAWIQQAVAAGRALTVDIETQLENTTASNVQTRITGRRPELPALIIMTPRSAWWTCTAERAGGIALWLNAIRYFAHHPPDRTVIFTANSGHELSHLGLDHYLESAHRLIAAAHVWVHLGANFAAVAAPIRFQASSSELLAEGLDALRTEGITDIETTPAGTRPFGEARNIHDGGGRYISLLGSNRWFHHPADRWPDAVDMDKAARLNKAMQTLVIALSRG
ncbi:MAG: hypothetical protein R3E82_13280 [Pseudomonadales bacterium]|nr:hypothetical protein [Pseudomonadales bacterium]